MKDRLYLASWLWCSFLYTRHSVVMVQLTCHCTLYTCPCRHFLLMLTMVVIAQQGSYDQRSLHWLCGVPGRLLPDMAQQFSQCMDRWTAVADEHDQYAMTRVQVSIEYMVPATRETILDQCQSCRGQFFQTMRHIQAHSDGRSEKTHCTYSICHEKPHSLLLSAHYVCRQDIAYTTAVCNSSAPCQEILCDCSTYGVSSHNRSSFIK